jgi:hypothetical protein
MPPGVAFFTAATLFILHHLVVPADEQRRWRAPYDSYFDEGWKDAVRLALAAFFVGALWLLLWLGATLFNLIGLKFLEKLITKPWFAFPATTTFFALAVHLTDVRAGLVQGARTLLLSLLSWLLPVFAVIAAGFLLALPFTGLKPLWSTRSASGVMLSACAALVVLINATYQDGEREGFPPAALKWATRLAAVTLAPLTLVAMYGVYLRVAQHGLSPSRIYAIACLVIAASYAAGYVWASIARQPWMKRIEGTNWFTAHLAVAVLLLIFSPALDPMRISVASQLHRLRTGAVSAEGFDYAFLRFRAGRWGAAALRELAAEKGEGRSGEIGERARTQLALKQPWDRPTVTTRQRWQALQVVGPPLPDSFLNQSWAPFDDPAANCGVDGNAKARRPGGCVATAMDLDGRPGPEIIVFDMLGANRVYAQQAGSWAHVGALEGSRCGDEAEALHAGRFAGVPANDRTDVDIAGRRFVFVPMTTCPTRKPRKPSE